MIYGRRRRLTAIFLSLVLGAAVAAAALTGCGSAKKEDTEEYDDSNVVYTEISLKLDDEDAAGTGNIYIGKAAAANGRYYVLFDKEGDPDGISILTFDASGKDIRSIILPEGLGTWAENISIAPDGRIFVMRSLYSEETDSSSWEVAAVSVSEDGETQELWKHELDTEDGFYCSGMTSSDNWTVLVSETDVRILDNTDGSEKTAPLPGKNTYNQYVCRKAGGDGILLVCSSDTGMQAWELDPEKGSFAQGNLSAEGIYADSTLTSGSGTYDFYCGKSDGIYGFTLDGAEPVKLMDYMASGLNIDYLTSCASLSPESFVLTSSGLLSDAGIILMQKAEPSKIGNRVTLTVGCTYAGSELRRQIVEFNKKSEKYRIVLKEYPYEEGKDGTYVSQMNSEITAGNIPDMIVITDDLPVQSYASKGLFEDLEPYFTADPEISQAEYLDNILDAFRMDGKMYFVVPSFNVLGLMGKKADFGDTKGLTVTQLDEMIRRKGLKYEEAMGATGRDTILGWLLYGSMDQFVDWEHGTCSFNSNAFINLLEFAGKFPKVKNYENIDTLAYQGNMRAGKQLLRDVYLYSFDAYMLERYGYIGEEISYMGYPGDGSAGPVAVSSMYLAMSHSAKDREGCWEFMRSFYLDDYQTSLDFSFPVSRNALEAFAEKAMTPETYSYTDDEGNLVEEMMGASITLSGANIEIPTPSRADIDAVIHILENVENRLQIDTNINEVVSEETSAFFAGQKSAREVANIIQSRVRIYISETR